MRPHFGCLIWRTASLPPLHRAVLVQSSRLCRLALLFLLDPSGSSSMEGQGTGPSWVLGSCQLLGQRGSIPFLGLDAVALGPSGQGWHLAVWGALTQRCSASGSTPVPLKLWAWGSASRQAAGFIRANPSCVQPRRVPPPGLARLWLPAGGQGTKPPALK